MSDQERPWISKHRQNDLTHVLHRPVESPAKNGQPLTLGSTTLVLPNVNGCPFLAGDSTGRCNTCVKSFCRCFEIQGLSWSLIQSTRHSIEFHLRVYRYVCSFGEVLPQ